jgi:hypothetical protein
MTMCNICLREQDTTKLDRLDLCSPCMKEVKNRMEEYEEESNT